MHAKIDKIPKEIFNIKINDVSLDSQSVLHICSENEIEKAQLGYRYNPEKKDYIKEWIGDNYYVIGYDDLCGDPIIIDVNDESNPIYFMWHDNWANIEKISSSLSNFISIYKILSENNTSQEKLLKIKNIDPMCYDYWNRRIGIKDIKETNSFRQLPIKNKFVIYICTVLFILLLILSVSLSFK